MPPNSMKTLSPAELAKLEHAFATDPASEAYRPLAEAYLAMGRFMEAMVVCKKGVKAHANDSEPRVLLARVYAEQGKDKKALEELQGALQVAPSDKQALRMAAGLQLKNGELDAGKANLLKAFTADPSDSETLALFTQWKIESPSAPAPPPAPAAVAPAEVRPGSSASATARPAPAPPMGREGSNAMRTRASAEAPRATAPVLAPSPRRPAPRVERNEAVDDSEDDDSQVGRPRTGSVRTSGNRSRNIFLVLSVVMIAGLVGYQVIGRYRAARNREFNKLLRDAGEQLTNDSYESYKKACADADKALELIPDSGVAHGYLAYAYAIRWGEHGEGDTARKLAEEHLDAAKKAGEVSSQTYSAEALIKTYSGKRDEALAELVERLKKFGKKGSLVNLTLGLIQMNAGDLEHSRESLEAAQANSSGDPRIYAALGTLFRRRGQDKEAWNAFEFALRFRPDHAESKLGKALLILEQDEPSYEIANKLLKGLIDATPAPSPRQLATAHLAKALMVSRLSRDLPQLAKEEQRKALIAATGVTLDKERNKAEVARLEDAGFALERSNPELFLIKGKRLLYENDVDGAVAEIRKAIALDGTRAYFHVELARALMRKDGGEKEAEVALRKALTTIPKSPKLVAMLGHVFMNEKKFDEALQQYELAVHEPGSKNPEARLSMGRIYREKKDFPKAIEAFEKAAQEYVGQPYKIAESYDELGVTEEAKPDRAKAAEAYEHALNADINFENAYCHYAKLLVGEPKSRGKAREVAKEYLKRAPKGDCASEMQRL